MASIDEHQRLKAKDSGQEKSFSDSWSAESSSSLEDVPEHERRQPKLKRKDTDAALSMRGMAGSGMLSKTEGTWCFWSPEMCEGSQAFSGYAADMWAAGVCLYIFVTGKLPFYSEVPHELFDMIASAEVPYSGLGLSNSLVDLLKRCLEKNPNKRAGVGDCLKHPFLQIAREKRIRQLGEEFEISKKRKIVISDEDIRSAFRAVTSVPVQVLRSAGKKIQESLAHTRDRFSISTSSMSGEGDSFVKHFQEGIHHLRTRLPSMGSTVHSCDEDSITGDNKHSKVWSAPPDLQHPASPSQSKQRAIFFRRGMSDDSDVSLNTFDGSSPVPSEKLTDSEMASPRVSRLSSMRSNSNLTDDVPAALLEVDIEEETERGEDDVAGPADFQSTNTATLETKLDSQDSATLGHRHEAPLGASDRSKEKVDLPLDWRNQKKKRRKGDGTPRCVIQ
jgi:serine/threonine protein kinase